MDVSSGRGSVRVCQRCGKQYQAGGYKFCSRECMLGTCACKKCGKAFQREAVGQKKCRACQGHAQERACPVCGKVVSLQAHRTYCSKACYEQARARVPDRCPVCGVDVPKGRLYCTDACRDKAHGMVRMCQQCGKEFKRGKPDQTYCSQECAWQAQKRVRNAVCQQCGKEFAVGRACKGMFCSKMCEWASMRVSHESEKGFADAVRWMDSLSRTMARDERMLIAVGCEQCGKGFVTTSRKARFCSDRCRKRHANRLKDRRVYRNGIPDGSITLERLFVRDGGRCRACGLLMTFDRDPNSDAYPSIDHIVPLSRGGLHQWSNVQLMCRGCNRAKRDFIEGGGPRPAWF